MDFYKVFYMGFDIFIKKVIHKLIWITKLLNWNMVSIFSQEDIYRFVLVDNSLLDYPIKSSIAKMLFLDNFENCEIDYVRNSLKIGDIFLDVGANAGIYTLLASKLVGNSGHVYSFEPSEREIKLLKHNIEINHLKNITIIEKAVSDHSGMARLAIAKDGGLNSLVDTNRHDQKIESWQNIETISLDEFLEIIAISKVDFVKIDVEGAEKLVFDGAKGLLQSANRPTILFESSNSNTRGFGYTANQFLGALLETGAELYNINQDGTSNRILLDDPRIGNEIYNFVLPKQQYKEDLKK